MIGEGFALGRLGIIVLRRHAHARRKEAGNSVRLQRCVVIATRHARHDAHAAVYWLRHPLVPEAAGFGRRRLDLFAS